VALKFDPSGVSVQDGKCHVEAEDDGRTVVFVIPHQAIVDGLDAYRRELNDQANRRTNWQHVVVRCKVAYSARRTRPTHGLLGTDVVWIEMTASDLM